MLTITNDGGAGNIVENTNPSQIDTKQIALETTIAFTGEAVMMFAVAAGVTMRAKIRRVPTAGTAIVITPAMSVI